MRELWMRLLRYFGLAKEQAPEPEPEVQTYIVLHKADHPTPSETVTSWDAYEAAPQEAKTPLEAIASFQRDSQLGGVFVAVPMGDWEYHKALLKASDA